MAAHSFDFRLSTAQGPPPYLGGYGDTVLLQATVLDASGFPLEKGKVDGKNHHAWQPHRSLFRCGHSRSFVAMRTVLEIKTAIETLTPEQRVELEQLLREGSDRLPATPPLPDQAARRRRILGDKVLPNYVLLAREGAI